ncbi:hypothetical protein ACSVUS_004840 [Vibrio alginolyticus]|uniref:DNA-binding protein n=1 Tax=Vibrio TaxID=662 RepID=UPI0015585153|nr:MULTISPECIES: DNA-binding protein [Vibrio]EGQ9765569.1 DNA-binding protein [Vibrio alginolyticus]EGR1564190.1 DNA-binding protein [Vibrio alginolyticus]EHI5144005.1 DNA-binding protein [Vibrio alginolyticus]EIE5866309.1 hypothetical protein [Vibrio alginolyticus]EJG1639900.1 hypothetical protein [Vibrio alginolyticus]
MNKNDFESLVEIRLKEAKLLLDGGSPQGAYYLAGYALEAALKASICMQVKENDFPDKKLAVACHTHNLKDLIGVAGLKQKLTEKENQDEEFKVNWAVAKDWSETTRYETDIDEIKANDLYEAITDEDSGVLVWLKNYW